MKSFLGEKLLGVDDGSDYKIAPPAAFDWRDKNGVVSPVKN